MTKENILRINDATMQFGGVVAVNNLNLEVNKGEIIGLIGPNGAGKTTVFNVITGVYAAYQRSLLTLQAGDNRKPPARQDEGPL